MKTIKKLLVLVMVFFAFAGFNCNAFAATNSLVLSGASVIEKSEDVVAENPTISGTSVSGKIVFHRVGDYAIYRFKIKNSTRTSFKILDITDDNASDYISYEYDFPVGAIVESGQTLNFDVKIIYANAPYDTDDMMESYDDLADFDWDNFYATRDQNGNVKFTISYLDLETGEEDESEIIIVPDTGTFTNDDATMATGSIVVAVIVGIVVAFFVAIFLKRKRAAAYCVCAVICAFAGLKYSNVMADIQADINIGVEGGIELRDAVCFRLALNDVPDPDSSWEEDWWCIPFKGYEPWETPGFHGVTFRDFLFGEFGAFPGYPDDPSYDGIKLDARFTGTGEEVPLDENLLRDFDMTVTLDDRETYDIVLMVDSVEIDRAEIYESGYGRELEDVLFEEVSEGRQIDSLSCTNGQLAEAVNDNVIVKNVTASTVCTMETGDPLEYHITYDYSDVYNADPSTEVDGYAVMEGIDNPTTYTIDDEITLDQPYVSGCSFWWTGSGIYNTANTVTISRGSTGDRTYILHVGCK